MPDIAPIPAARTEAVAAAMSRFLDFVDVWDSIRLHPDVCDFAFGNPQELPLPEFSAAIQRYAEPR
ncbi:MAG TPA: hypothetical protein VFE49_12955, partial [Jiangellaceae bacterium]|nr:hypothetical protein [Jiangellaceae bacterium]